VSANGNPNYFLSLATADGARYVRACGALRRCSVRNFHRMMLSLHGHCTPKYCGIVGPTSETLALYWRLFFQRQLSFVITNLDSLSRNYSTFRIDMFIHLQENILSAEYFRALISRRKIAGTNWK